MAREESDREDLLEEATALVERVELAAEGLPAPLVIGFRANGAASLFFGADPVYHFDAQGRVRRAYVEGLLYKADRGRLASLRRQRAADGVTLWRHDLTADEQAAFLGRLADLLAALQDAILRGAAATLRQVPPGEDLQRKVAGWLSDRTTLEVAERPHVAG